MNSQDRRRHGSDPPVTEAVLTISAQGCEIDETASALFGTQSPIAEAELPVTGPKMVSPSASGTLAQWLWHEMHSADLVASRWRVFCETGCVDALLTSTEARLRSVALPAAARSFRHEVRNFVNAVQVNAELIALYGEKAGEPRIIELIDRIKRSCGSLEAALDGRGSVMQAACDAVTGLCRALERFGLQVRPPASRAVEVPLEWCQSGTQLVLEWLAAEGQVSCASGLELDVANGVAEITVRDAAPGRADAQSGALSWFAAAEDAPAEGAPAEGDAPDLTVPGAPQLLAAAGIGYGFRRSRGATAVLIALP